MLGPIIAFMSILFCGGIVFANFSRTITRKIRLVVVYSCLTALGLCNFVMYSFGNHFLGNFIVGVILIVEAIALACTVIYKELD